jgi:hypothetical protein
MFGKTSRKRRDLNRIGRLYGNTERRGTEIIGTDTAWAKDLAVE